MPCWKACLALVSLVVGVGCARPPAEPWPKRVRQALLERRRDLPEDARADFEAGFANGATMVREALKAGVRPYRPMLNRAAPAPRWQGTRPAGVEIEPFQPTLEVDPGTGLILHAASGEKSSPFAQGQVDGFSWALAAIGQHLVHPVPVLGLPPTWIPWKSHQSGEDLTQGAWTVRLLWAPGQLSWRRKEHGFPDQRAWRPWEDPEPPSWVGLSEGAMWLETSHRQAIAMDLESGGILAVRPAVPHPAPEARDSDHQDILREFHSPEYQRGLEALRKAAEAGKSADLWALAEYLRGMGPQADREAYDWYLKAAEKGSPKAMLRVGVCLFHGQPIPADRTAARGWMERASQAGEPNAAVVIRMLFDEEKGPPPSAVVK